MTSLPRGPHAARDQRVARLLQVAQLGYAHWLFGNLYEAVVRVPDRLAQDGGPGAEDRRLTSVLSPGSPVRYYLPGIPVIIGATLSALVAGWPSRRDRPWLGAITLSTLSGVALTGYLVRAVNLRLFVAGAPVTPAERERLLRIWYRLNAVRIVSAASAWLLAAGLVARRS